MNPHRTAQVAALLRIYAGDPRCAQRATRLWWCLSAAQRCEVARLLAAAA